MKTLDSVLAELEQERECSATLAVTIAEQHAANAALTLENTRLLAQIHTLRAALDETEAARVEDDYPSAVFRQLWRVLVELRAATAEEGRA